MVVYQPLQAMARLGEKRTRSVVTKRVYRSYLDLVGCADEACPHAWWHGGDNTVTLRVMFHASEATVRCNVIPKLGHTLTKL